MQWLLSTAAAGSMHMPNNGNLVLAGVRCMFMSPNCSADVVSQHILCWAMHKLLVVSTSLQQMQKAWLQILDGSALRRKCPLATVPTTFANRQLWALAEHRPQHHQYCFLINVSMQAACTAAVACHFAESHSTTVTCLPHIAQEACRPS